MIPRRRFHKKGSSKAAPAGPGARPAGPGQPRIDPEAPLVRRSVGLPVSWWKAVDDLAAERGVTASVLVRAAVGVELRRVGRIRDRLRKTSRVR